MPNIIDEAKNELGSALVVYTEFVLDFKKDSETIYCFYEGNEDRSYYSFRIKTLHHTEDFSDYICNGKGNLTKLHTLINKHLVYKNSNIGYFIDKDFDNNDVIEKLYCTPFYSVENFYILDKSYENILINEFNIPKSCNCFEQSMILFKDCKELFHSNIVYLNSWLSCQNDIRISTNMSTRLNIDKTLKTVLPNFSLEKIVNPDLKSLNFPLVLLTQEGIESLFLESPRIAKETYEAKLEIFKKLEGDKYFRGKFELKFLISFLNRFKEEIGKRKDSIFEKRYSSSLRFEYVTSISQLTNNAITPDCLINYIKKIKNVA